MLEYKIRYDPEAGILYVKLKDNEIAESEEVNEGVIIDYDDRGEVVGIEFLEFSRKKIDIGQLIVRELFMLL